MDELEIGPHEELLSREAERLLPGRVQALEVAVEACDAEHVERGPEKAVQLRLRVLALDELADLSADGGHHPEQILIGLADLAAEELEHAQDRAAEEDRESEGSMQPILGGDGR